jgi:signal transduction histidine kinase
VVANLVDNAAKLTPPGGRVSVSVARANGRALIEVADTGPGVPDDERERVFERFYRGAGARAASPGFGLGLSLGREIARALGGELTLLPSEKGARFQLALPIGDQRAS